MKLVSPPTLGIRNLAASSWGPVAIQTGSHGRPHSCPSFWATAEDGAGTGKTQGSSSSLASLSPDGRQVQSFNPTEGSRNDQFQKNKESLTP